MRMVESMARVEQLARRGLPKEQICKFGFKLPARTIEAIIAQTETSLADEAAEARRQAMREMRAREDRAHKAGLAEREMAVDTPVSLDRVLHLCATRAGLTVEEFLKPSRHVGIAQVRQEAMYLALVLTTETVRIISEAFERDEKTIRHGGCTHAARVGLAPPRGLSAVPTPKRNCLPFLCCAATEGAMA